MLTVNEPVQKTTTTTNASLYVCVFVSLGFALKIKDCVGAQHPGIMCGY